MHFAPFGGWTRWPTKVPSNPYHSVITELIWRNPWQNLTLTHPCFFHLLASLPASGKWKTKHPWMGKHWSPVNTNRRARHTNDSSKTEWVELHGRASSAKHVAYRWSYHKSFHCSLGSVFSHSRSVHTHPGETPKQGKTEAILNIGSPHAYGYTNNYHSINPKSIRGTSKFLTSTSTPYTFLLRPLPTSIQLQATACLFWA